MFHFLKCYPYSFLTTPQILALCTAVEVTQLFDKMADLNGKTRMFHVIMYIEPLVTARNVSSCSLHFAFVRAVVFGGF